MDAPQYGGLNGPARAAHSYAGRGQHRRVAFYRPTREQIRRRVQSDFKAAFGNDAVLYEGTVEHGFAEALVGLSHAKHGRLDQIYRDAFPHLASDAGVVKWASFFGIFRTRATYATGTVTVAGDNGAEIPAGSIITRDADGFEYRTLDLWTIGGGPNHVPVQARVPGSIGNATGMPVTDMHFQSAIAGVSSFCEPTGVDGLTGGADAETIPALRTRLLAALAEPAGGGKVGDYVRWAKLVTGVTRAWEYGNEPAVGDVTVLIMRDLDVDPFPGAPEVAEVLAKIVEFAPIALPTPTVQAPIKYSLALEIELTIEAGAVLADVKAAIVAAVQDMLATRAAPPADVGGGVLYRSWITEAISSAVGELDHKLNVPGADVTLAQWEIPTLDSADVTWV